MLDPFNSDGHRRNRRRCDGVIIWIDMVDLFINPKHDCVFALASMDPKSTQFFNTCMTYCCRNNETTYMNTRRPFSLKILNPLTLQPNHVKQPF